MINNGAKIPTLDHRDRDFLKSFHPEIAFGAAKIPQFPDEYNTDAGLWIPNQNIVNAEFPKTAAQPYGCTNYTSSDVATDLDGVLHDPGVMELLTHANEKGGFQVRDSLMIAKKIGLITGFYNIKAIYPLDYFDAIRLAMMSGIPEKRSVSVGTPWYGEWQNAAEAMRALVPMPQSLNYTGLPWHNWKIAGWKLLNGSPCLIGKVWEGASIGDHGWLCFDRATINAVMNLRYTIAFTATHVTPTAIYKVDMAMFDKFYSYLKTLTGLRY